MTEQAVGCCEYAEQVLLGKILDLKGEWLPPGGNKCFIPLFTLLKMLTNPCRKSEEYFRAQE